ncbi:MAG: AAA family ATPase [Myxococcales bacterium]|nr:AAA family ATPase [Myxococcales bacterium]
MYHEFYALREKPFSLSPDPRFLFLSDSHREALAHLLYGIEQGEGFIVLTGEVGTGKTTLSRTLLQRIEPGTEIAFIFNPQLSASELLQSICAELGLPAADRTRREMMDALNRFLLAKKAEGRRVILLIDEAQNLPPDTLEQVRLLSNLETDTEKLLQIILIGQPELDAILESPSLRQLNQRISVRWRLSTLTALETRDYVKHRLRIAAGAPREIFTDLALREVHRRSAGVPRLVNLLCDRALLAGFGAGARSIGLSLVSQSDREVRGGGRPYPTEFKPSLLDRLLPAPMQQLLSAVLLVSIGVLGALVGQRLWLRSAALPAVSAPPPVAAPLAPLPPPLERSVSASPAASAPQQVAALAPPAEQVRPAEESPPTPGERAPVPVQLSLALDQSSPSATTANAIARLFGMWKGEYEGPSFLSLEEGLALLGEAEISTLAVRSGDLETIQRFNYPALIQLQAVDGAPRAVLLQEIRGEDAILVGLLGETPVVVPLADLLERWTGNGYIAWRDFARLPDLLAPGQTGDSVAWLQRSLHELGFLGSAIPSGVFDGATAEAVRALQRARNLSVDGTVGPFTKMVLYEALSAYAIPRLVRREVG